LRGDDREAADGLVKRRQPALEKENQIPVMVVKVDPLLSVDGCEQLRPEPELRAEPLVADHHLA
jgi:hypothetical protein